MGMWQRYVAVLHVMHGHVRSRSARWSTNDSVKPCRPSWTVNPRVICWVSHLRHFVTRPKVPILAHAVWRVFSTSPPHVGAPLSGLRSSKLEKIAPEYRGEVYSNILKGREKPANHLGEIAISLLRFFNEEHGNC